MCFWHSVILIAKFYDLCDPFVTLLWPLHDLVWPVYHLHLACPLTTSTQLIFVYKQITAMWWYWIYNSKHIMSLYKKWGWCQREREREREKGENKKGENRVEVLWVPLQFTFKGPSCWPWTMLNFFFKNIQWHTSVPIAQPALYHTQKLIYHCLSLKGILLTLNYVDIFFFQISNDIHLPPKYNQPPCTETHLLLCVDSLPREDQDAPLRAWD